MKYLVTGGAGFIGSNIVEKLLHQDQEVMVLDNFCNGKKSNIKDVISLTGKEKNFHLIEGDIRSLSTCLVACEGVDYVIHCAALGSVPGSVDDPLLYNEVNITGTLNVLEAARQKKVKRLVYSASSAAYGETPQLPKVETILPDPKSPYAVSKLVGEYYCKVYFDVYGLETVVLRYFNVYGKRQDPNSQYAAVIPKFVALLLKDTPPTIYGDGGQTRDFVQVEDIVQANLKACLADKIACGQIHNIGYGESYNLNQLYDIISRLMGKNIPARYEEVRAGDVRNSLADVSLAKQNLGFSPKYNLQDGLTLAIDWYKDNL